MHRNSIFRIQHWIKFKQTDNVVKFYYPHYDNLQQIFIDLNKGDVSCYNYARSNHDEIPSIKGVYIIALCNKKSKKSQIAYIGCSKSVNRRLYSHTVLKFLLSTLHPNYRVDIYIIKTDKHLDSESSLIVELKPFLNYIPKMSKIEFRLN